MSFYKSSIKTNLIDPVLFQSNRRAEFRFGKDQVLLSNMRVANIGITAPADAAGAFYTPNKAAGLMEVIKSITLYDGSQVLDQQLKFDMYAAFKNYNKDNSSNYNVNHFLNNAGMGYNVVGLDVIVAANTTFITSLFAPTPTTANENDTPTIWLDLKACLPMLQSVLYLPTSIFKNLRLVIEFNDNVAANQNTLTPLLIADEMSDTSVKNQLLTQFKGVDFVSVETDSLVVDAVFKAGDGVDKPQSITKQLKGFNNKVLNKFFVVKQPSVPTAATTIRRLGSHLYFNEADNVRINGRNLLVGNGIDTTAKSLAALSDTYGPCNSYLNYQTLVKSFINTAVLNDAEIDMLANQDYRAFRVGERVLQLDYQFSRLGVFDTDETVSNAKSNNSATTLHFFGEVPKRLQVNPNGTYIIGYA
jgi:hypothetical protein